MLQVQCDSPLHAELTFLRHIAPTPFYNKSEHGITN
jgi:hypothetical protein